MGVGKHSKTAFTAAYIFLACVALVCAGLALADLKQELLLYPRPGVAAHLFSDAVEPDGKSSSSWIDRGRGRFVCEIAYGVQYPYCGLVLKFKNHRSPNYDLLDYFEFSDAGPIDLSQYDGVSISLDYSGESKVLNFFMRSAESPPRSGEEYERVPYAHKEFGLQGGRAFVEFSHMNIAKWWIDRMKPAPDQLEPKFTGVFELGVDLPPLPVAGVHRFQLNSISAIRSYISQTHLMAAVVAAFAIAVLLGIIQILLAYTTGRYREEAQSLRSTMIVDPLTKCLNRLGLETAISGVFPLSNASKIYLMVLDLDHFKRVNDTLGHAAGDEVLRKTSLAIASQLRSDDVFGRWGGEEFVIISKISREHLEPLISRLMDALKSVKIDGAADDYEVTMSVGITEAKIGEPFGDVFKRADEAMYQVKLAGRRNWKLV